MEEKVKKYIQQNHMLQAGDHVIIGLSGGKDSVCLLHLMLALQDEMKLTLEAVHVHHGLRGDEADRDADFAAGLCRSLGVPLTVVKADVAAYARENGLSVEEGGRKVRYEAFAKQSDRWKDDQNTPVRIAVAHHGDDNCETVLLNLIRGTGLRGMGGIPPVRGEIIRPLLCCTGEEIRQWLLDRSLCWVEDGTNEDTAYTRNYIRHRILEPVRKDLQPRIAEHILENTAQARDVYRYVEEQAANAARGCMRYLYRDGRQRSGAAADKESFLRADKVLRPYMLRILAEMAGISVVNWTSRHYDSLLELFAGETGSMIDLPTGVQAGACAREVWLVPGGLSLPEIAPVEAVVPGVVSAWETGYVWHFSVEEARPAKNNEKNLNSPYTKCFNYDRILEPLWIRSRRQGDYVELPAGGRQKLKDYMINEKIPRWQRNRIPLLASGSRILWIPGRRCFEQSAREGGPRLVVRAEPIKEV